MRRAMTLSTSWPGRVAQVPPSTGGASTHCLLVDWPAPVRRTCLGGHFTQDHVRDRTRLRTRATSAPPRNVGQWLVGAPRAVLRPCLQRTSSTDNRVTPSGCAWREPRSVVGFITPTSGGANIFFHFTALTNADFNDLRVGGPSQLGRNDRGPCAVQVWVAAVAVA